MFIKKVGIGDVSVINIDKKKDERGFFARTFCREELKSNGINFEIAQCNMSHNEKKYTLRGLHYQTEPYEEGKIVACYRGAIFDVAVDVRPDSSTYLKWFGCELSQDNYTMLYIPKGFAHGYMTLTDNALVGYYVSTAFAPQAGTGYRWNDPAIGIKWPSDKELILSQKDSDWPYIKDRG